MRKKLREIMNKEEGFTLVELLAVIVILGIIVAIAIPAVGSVIDNARGNAQKAEEELIIDAARLYDIEEGIPSEGVLIVDLIEDGYLELRGDADTDTSGVVREATDEDDEDTPYVIDRNVATDSEG